MAASEAADMTPARQCGGCTLCCKLLPVDHGAKLLFADGATQFVLTPGALQKPAGERCPHQRSGKGCAIYATRPDCCTMWSCRWVKGELPTSMRRPDRVHYCIAREVDVLRCVDDKSGRTVDVDVVIIWVDPDYPDVWKTDPDLRAYMLALAEQGIGSMVTFSDVRAISVLAPPLTGAGWIEREIITVERPGVRLPLDWHLGERVT